MYQFRQVWAHVEKVLAMCTTSAGEVRECSEAGKNISSIMITKGTRTRKSISSWLWFSQQNVIDVLFSGLVPLWLVLM
jgi:hypothetical protein